MTRRNLISNPSFETNATGWTMSGAGGPVTSFGTPAGFSGVNSGRNTASGTSGSGLTQEYVMTTGPAVTVGSVYTASCYVNRSSRAGNVRIDVQWYNGSGALISTTTGATSSAAQNAWARRSVTGTAPTGAATARLRVVLSNVTGSTVGTGDVHGLDAVMLEEGADLSDYADGDSPGWTWDGTAHASASREAYTDVPLSTLNRVLGGQVQLSDGTHAYLEYNDTPDATLDSGALRLRHHNGTAASDVATLSLGASSGFALDMRGGLQSFALTRDAADNLYVVSRLGGSTTQVAAQAFAKGSGYAWTARTLLSQQMGLGTSAAGSPDGWAAAWHAAGGTAGTVVALMSRTAGSSTDGQQGAVLLNADALLAGTGTLLRGTATLDGLFTTPTTGDDYHNPYLTGFDVAAASSTRGYAVTWNRGTGGASWTRYTLNSGGSALASTAKGSTTSGVVKHEDGKARVVALSESAFVAATAHTSGALQLSAYQNNGTASTITTLGTETIGGTGSGAETVLSSFPNLAAAGAVWDIDYDPSAGRIWVYYFDTANARRLLRTGWATDTYLADGVAVEISAAVGASGSTQRAVRVHRGASTGSVALVSVANETSAGVHSTVYVLDQHNVPPTAPTLNTAGNFDATLAKTLTWVFNDPNVGDAQSAYQLQVQTNVGAAQYDSAKTTSTASSHVLTAGTLSNPGSWQWRVKTWDRLGEESPFSSFSPFSTQTGGSVAITSPPADNPAEGSDVADWLIGWSVAGTTQDAYRVRVFNNATAVELSTTGWVSSTATERTVSLPSGTEWRVEVTVRSAGVESGPASRLITPTYGDPMQPAATADALPDEACVLITISNPTPEGDRPEVVRNDIYRRRAGSSDVFVLAGAADWNGVFRDYGAASGVAYDYFVRGVTE